ncbi:MAG: DUF1206 domain-containing protein [Cyanobacteria bacterium J06649_4]
MTEAESSDKHHIKKWLELYARAGYGAKGIIYGTVGLLALFQAMDFQIGETVGSEDVLRRVAAQPFGQGLLLLLCISLVGYVVWRFLQAVLDPEHNGCDSKDVVRRISYACSGVAYAGLAFSAIEILSLDDNGDSGEAAGQLALAVMTKPFGRWIVAAGGLLFVGIGGYYFYRALKAAFRKRFKRHYMSDTEKTWATIVGRVGIAARGVVYAVIGCYGVRAALKFDPEMIKTTEDVFSLFENNATDEWILATLGIGFIAYGLHMGFQCVYRQISPL